MLIRRARLAFGGGEIICVGTSATMASGGTTDEEKEEVADVDATGYVFKPLDWAGTPDYSLRKHFNETDINEHLDAIESGQQEDGGWNITWEALT